MHYIRFSTNPFVHAQFMPVPNNFHPFKGQELAKGLHQRKLTSKHQLEVLVLKSYTSEKLEDNSWKNPSKLKQKNDQKY